MAYNIENKDRVVKKKKIDQIKKKKIADCKVICICTVTSSLHVVIPVLKALHSLGTVQVISEDRSLISLNTTDKDTVFTVEDVTVEIIQDFGEVPDDVYSTFVDYDYTILVTHDIVPFCDIDKFIILGDRHYFRKQLDTAEQRYTPIISVYNPRLFKPADRELELSKVYVNETVLALPSYAICQDYLDCIIHNQGKREFRINSKIIDFTLNCLEGINGCNKTHLRTYLMKGGGFLDSNN